MTTQHGRSRGPRIALVAAVAAALVAPLALASPAHADTPSPMYAAKATTWVQAASDLGTAGSLWAPTERLGLPRRGPITVMAENLVVVNGAVRRGGELLPATGVSARYGTNARGFTILEKWADTAWALDPSWSWHAAPVGTVRIPLLPRDPDMPNTVTARVFANCWKPASTSPSEPPKAFRCTTDDVQRYGGYLTLTAKPASTMTAPGRTSVWIESTGLAYDDLVRIARGLQQETGRTDLGIGNAQMQATCRQMVEGRMTEAQASTLAAGNGYTVRVVERDGQPLPATMDYRVDRINVAVTSGIVTGCVSNG